MTKWIKTDDVFANSESWTNIKNNLIIFSPQKEEKGWRVEFGKTNGFPKKIYFKYKKDADSFINTFKKNNS